MHATLQDVSPRAFINIHTFVSMELLTCSQCTKTFQPPSATFTPNTLIQIQSRDVFSCCSIQVHQACLAWEWVQWESECQHETKTVRGHLWHQLQEEVVQAVNSKSQQQATSVAKCSDTVHIADLCCENAAEDCSREWQRAHRQISQRTRTIRPLLPLYDYIAIPHLSMIFLLSSD